MTPLKSPISRMTVETLNGSFGSDRGRRVALRLIPGKPATADHPEVPSLVELRPERTQRAETIAVPDLLRLCVWSRVNRAQLEKARAKKAKLAAARESRRWQRELRKPL